MTKYQSIKPGVLESVKGKMYNQENFMEEYYQKFNFLYEDLNPVYKEDDKKKMIEKILQPADPDEIEKRQRHK